MMLWGIFRVSAKLVATAVLSIAILIVGFVFAPNFLSALLDGADVIERWLPTAGDLNLKDQIGAMYRNVVNDTTIFGILLSLVARVVVEVVWGLFAMAFGKPRSETDLSPTTTSTDPFDL